MPTKPHIVAAVGGLALIIVAVAVIVGLRSPAKDLSPWTLLLITLDTTRADRLGCYGYERARTPSIDGIAESGVLVEDAFTPVPITLPAHATLFTSKLPPEHGIRVNGENGLAKDLPVLADVLHEHGYRTGAFVSASVLNSVFGLDRGFDLYDDQVSRSGGGPDEAIRERRADSVVDAALAWLNEQEDAPFFCWVHLFDPHFPYEAPAPHGETGHPYDGEIAFADSQIGRLTAWLDARSLRDRTLAVLTADHGESLGEHGEATHGFLVHDATMRVPLIFSMPGVLNAGRRINGPAGLVDLMPTVLELLGVPEPAQLSGRSIKSQLYGHDADDPTYYAEAWTGLHQFGWSPLQSLTAKRWKYIHAPAPELYDRRNDPGERKNVATTNRRVLADMEEALAHALDGMARHTGQSVQLPESLRQQIESLGYFAGSGGGAGTTGAQDPAQLKNPRQMMGVFDRYCRARGLIIEGRLEEGIALMAQVATDTPESLIVHCELSTAYSQAGQFDEALASAGAAGKLAPSSPDVFYALGVAAAGQRSFEEAETHFRRAVELRPSFKFARNNLGLSLVELGRPEEAIEQFNHVLRLSPDEPTAHFNLALALTRLGRGVPAIAALERCEELDPDDPKVLYRLARLLLGEGRYEQAIDRYRRGVAVAPEFAGFTNGLAWMLATCPQAELRNGTEAVALAVSTWERSPKADPSLLDTLAAAYAECGRFEEAVAAADKALALVQTPQHAHSKDQIEAHLAIFRSGQPLRDRPPSPQAEPD